MPLQPPAHNLEATLLETVQPFLISPSNCHVITTQLLVPLLTDVLAREVPFHLRSSFTHQHLKDQPITTYNILLLICSRNNFAVFANIPQVNWTLSKPDFIAKIIRKRDTILILKPPEFVSYPSNRKVNRNTDVTIGFYKHTIFPISDFY